MFRNFMPIAAAFAPNYTWGDFVMALKLYFAGKGKFLDGENIRGLEEDFGRYMGVSVATSFDSGRSGFYAILKGMGVGEGDEVILQAFTTVALANVIKLLGAVPIYVDIEEKTFNMDPGKLEEKIGPKTKAVVIQHTFGNPADMRRILDIAGRHGIKTIEDCAHSLGAEYQGKKTGRFADAAFFSFGRDKVISSVAGGMVIAKDVALMEKIIKIREGLPFPAKRETKKKLLHPIVTFPALHLYNFFSLGKAMMYAAYKLNILDNAYTKKEKRREPVKDFAKKMPEALAVMARRQLAMADQFNMHRIEIAKIYEDNINPEKASKPASRPGDKNIFLWYTITVNDKQGVISRAAKKNIILGDWFPQAVGPIEVDLKKAGYAPGSCPVAEKVSARCVNLPTHHDIRKEEAIKVAVFVNGI